jgi:uncharacterized protein (TIGR03083 family)
MADLVGHTARIHRWATDVVRSGARPDGFPGKPSSGDEPDFLRHGVVSLTESLRGIDPGASCWNFLGANNRMDFWPRRQAHETIVHRIDGELAAGVDIAPLDPDLAADGVDELLATLAATRLQRRDGIDVGGSIRLRATDTEGDWTIRTTDGWFDIARNRNRGDALIEGPALDLLLVLWGRRALGESTLHLDGDEPLIARFLTLNLT